MKTTGAGKAAAKRAAAKPRKPKMITPEQALANTYALLKAKQQAARQPPSYPTSDPAHPGNHGGQVSHGAADAANERHFGEVNHVAIQGHGAAQARSNQGKRDQR